MRTLTKLLTVAAVVIGFYSVINTPALLSNPIPDPLIAEFSTNPDWIGIYTNEDTVISDYTLIVDGDTIDIDDGLFTRPEEIFFLDQSNTSGFDLSETGSIIHIIGGLGGEDWACYGTKGVSSAPPIGYYSGYAYEFHTFYLDVPISPLWPEPQERDVVLNELTVNNTWGDGNYIELYNTTDDPVDIGDWEIVSNSRYIIPEGTIAKPHKFFTLRERDFPEFFTPLTDGDNIYLVNSDNKLVDQVGWSSDHGEDVSFKRYPDGYVEDYWGYYGYNNSSSSSFSDGFPTRNGSNRNDCPGFIVIGTDAVKIDLTVRVIWSDPLWDAEYAGAKLIRSSHHFPQDIYDGREIYDGINGEYLDTEIIENQAYYYSIFAYTYDGEYSPFGSESCDSIPGIRVSIDDPDDSPLPRTISIRAYPNPFNAMTTFEYGLIEDCNVELDIYNLSGRQIASLVNDRQEAGSHNVQWNVDNYSSGIYFYKLIAGNKAITKKMTLMK